MDPVSGNIVSLFHPRSDNWHEHFHWSNDFTEIIGLTDRARATIEKLQLNRSALIIYAVYWLGLVSTLHNFSGNRRNRAKGIGLLFPMPFVIATQITFYSPDLLHHNLHVLRSTLHEINPGWPACDINIYSGSEHPLEHLRPDGVGNDDPVRPTIIQQNS